MRRTGKERMARSVVVVIIIIIFIAKAVLWMMDLR
jgi:hypothetical protein